MNRSALKKLWLKKLKYLGPCFTLLAVFGLHLLSYTRYPVLAPIGPLMIFITFSTVRSGIKAGMASAFISCTYFAYLLFATGAFETDPTAWHRLVTWSIICPAVVYLMARFKNSEIREAQLYLESIIQNIPTAVFVKDTRTLKYVHINRAAAEGLGMTSELIGKTAHEFFPVEQADSFEKNDRMIIDLNGEVNIREVVVETKTGPVLLRIKKTVILDDESRPKYLLGIAEDITYLRKTQAERDLIFENSQDIMVMANSDGLILRASPAVTPILGYTPEEFLAIPYFDMIHVDDAAGALTALENLKNGETTDIEVRFLCKNGSYKWIAWKAVRDGEMVYTYGRDTTSERSYKLEVESLNRRLHERVVERTRELEISAGKFESLISSNLMGIFFWNSEGEITGANNAFLEIIGYSNNDLEEGHIHWEKCAPAEFTVRDKESLKQLFNEGSCDPWESEFLHKNGKRIPILTGATLLDREKNEGVCFIHDLTQKKQSEKERSEMFLREQQALSASEMKSSFLANMSHEIRTPINGVIGMASLLLETPLDEQQQQFSQLILSSADTLLHLVNDILDLSRAEAGKIKLEKIDFDLCRLIDDVEKVISISVKAKGLSLVCLVAPNIPNLLSGDPTRLTQILVNLISNAVKFTTEGQITLKITLAGQDHEDVRLAFEVQDTGIGIPIDSQEKLFQPFTQADESTNRKFGGTGLGLSISKHLVDLMGGQIGIISASGEGSTFWFNVMFNLGAKAMRVSNQSNDQIVIASKKLHILVAEDNSVNQMIAMGMIHKMGHSAFAVANGLEALEELKNSKYDLILMDCQMPEVDGYQATRRIRAGEIPESRDIPIVALTAHAMKGDREKCLESGMDDYLSKPVKQKELAETIERNYEARIKRAA